MRSYGDVLMVSTATRGHLTPMIYVANRLMGRGITVTVLIPEDQQSLLEPNSEAGGLLSVELVQPFSKLREKADGKSGSSSNMEHACEPFFQRLLEERESGSAVGPKIMISDQFVWWTQDWGKKLCIPRYVSYPSPATHAMILLFHAPIEDQLAHDHASEKEPPDNFSLDVPHLPFELHRKDLSPGFLHSPSFRVKVLDRTGDSLRDAAGILFNTFYELESEAIDNIRAEIQTTSPQGKVTKMLPIGPMLPPAFFGEEPLLAEATKNSECLHWLDTRPTSSVLYIAFGSMAYLSPNQIQELAYGLETSNVSFLWILRVQGSEDVSQLLPDGFPERTKDRGFVYSQFAPQLQILSHPATAGFLTHCGWNSSLEAICRGIPMVGWPMGAEQRICIRILVDFAKVATEIERGPDNSAGRDDIAKAINSLLTGPHSQNLKQRALELQRQARAAVSPGGSSQTNFDTFVDDILELQK